MGSVVRILTRLLWCVWLAGVTVGYAQTITGLVKDKTTGEALIGARIMVKNSQVGTMSDADGKFKLNYTDKFPVVLVFHYVGYQQLEVNVTTAAKPVVAEMLEVESVGPEVVIVDTRITEKQKESPLTVESMDVIGIKETPAANFYEGLANLKGVDLTASSLGFKIINTRGFNSTRPVRSLQLIDGVDNQAPGLNFSLGNFMGASELDVQSVELVVGASSAQYGPNAFNGVVNMTTKSPFLHPGFSAMVKVGERDLTEIVVRHAFVINNSAGDAKWGFKFNYSLMKAYDWMADNMAPTTQSLAGTNNPGGYDAVNRYGDENITTGANNFSDNYGRRNFPGLNIYHRTGYLEKDLVDYNTRSIKLAAAAYFKPTAKTELIYSYNFGTGTTVYQGDNRYSLKDIIFQQHRLEFKGDKFMVRAYTTQEDAGRSYDAVFTALLLERYSKSDNFWSQDYSNYWSRMYPRIRQLPGMPGVPVFDQPGQTTNLHIADSVLGANYDSLLIWHQLARNYADGIGNPLFGGLPRLQPGTPEFVREFNRIINNTTFIGGGSRFWDKSALAHIMGEYKFTPKFAEIKVGVNYRLYLPNSQGTIFSDTSGKKITNDEIGSFITAEKKFLADRLKVNIALRIDKNRNFNTLFSPAASAVYSIRKNHNFRLSFSSALRNPTLQDQYLYYNVGRAILIGNIEGVDTLVTLSSLVNFYNSAFNYDTLEFAKIKRVRPERVRSIEIGYKGTLFGHLFIDASAYMSWYYDFLGYRLVSTAPSRDPNVNRPITVYRVSANTDDMVVTNGFSIATTYFFKQHYSVNGNYSYNVLDRLGSIDPIIPAFNTPKHKFNIGVSGREFQLKMGKINIRNVGFSVNYKWVEGFLFEGSPQFTGYVPTYDLVDAQVNYRDNKLKTTFKLGASNLLNNAQYQVYGGPKIGRLAYFSATVDLQ
ncbi:MAG: TonB-dependent receptor [Bacteroidia bacterium]|nr:TonB-dependent receptor [Bacteroidia bacterium]